MSRSWKDKLRNLFGGPRSKPAANPEDSAPIVLSADENPWRAEVLDLRPTTENLVSASKVREYAENAVSYGREDGSSFEGMVPKDTGERVLDLRIPTDGRLLPGVLFRPQTMEHKWAIYAEDGRIVFIRSWLREVMAVAKFEQQADAIHLTLLRGGFMNGEDALSLERVVEYLLRTHALGEEHFPCPLLPGAIGQPREAALWCFSLFGSMAKFATEASVTGVIDSPLRTDSRLHIAVAQNNREAVSNFAGAGYPLTALATDGLAPLHWSIALESHEMLSHLLSLGAPADSRSIEGATPLMNATQSQLLPHARALLDSGAEVNAQDHRGFTALHRAAEMGHTDLVRCLLGAGADASISAHGHTAKSLAISQNHGEIVHLLRAAP